MELRFARAEDLDAVMEIERASFSVPWSRQGIEFELYSRDARFIVAEEGELAGFAILHLFGEEAELFNIAVAERFRRSGVGDALLGYTLRVARESAINRVLLEVRQSNAAARALYKKHGFEVLGLRPRYYDNPKEDAVMMELRLE